MFIHMSTKILIWLNHLHLQLLDSFAWQQTEPQRIISQVPVDFLAGLLAGLHVDPVVPIVPEALDPMVQKIRLVIVE